MGGLALLQALGGAGANLATAKDQLAQEAINKKLLDAQLHSSDVDNQFKLAQLKGIRNQNPLMPVGGAYKKGGKQFQKFWNADLAQMVELPMGEDDPVANLSTVLGIPADKITPEQREIAAGIRAPLQTAKPEVPKLSEMELISPKDGKTHTFLYDEHDPSFVPVDKGLTGVKPSNRVTVNMGGGRPTESVQDAALTALSHPDGFKQGVALYPSKRTKGDTRPTRSEIMSFIRTNPNLKAQRTLNPQEQRTVDTIQQLDPMVNDLVKMLEPIKKQDDFIFGKNSAVANRGRDFLYKHLHMSTDTGDFQDKLRETAGFISGIAPAQWTTLLGRSKYTYDNIRYHLPDPNDTPKLMYSKALFLRDKILPVAKKQLNMIRNPDVEVTPEGTPENDTANDPAGLFK